MTQQEKNIYRPVEELRRIIINLRGMKFKLDCSHHVTFGSFLGNSIVIQNSKHPGITCTLCSY
jgi:hypothetical protein